MAASTGLPALNDDNVTMLSETLFTGFYTNPLTAELNTFVPGIKNGKDLVIFSRHAGLAGYNQVACATTANTTWGVAATSKIWATKYIGDRIEECADDYLDRLWRYSMKPGADKYDLTGTEFAVFIEAQLTDALWEIYMRHVWFGDTAIVAGTLNNLAAGTIKFFNAIDGLWKQIFAIGVATPARKTSTGTAAIRIAALNVAASYALQAFTSADLTAQTATEAMKKVWYDADIRLRGLDKSKLRFYVTQSVYDQYEQERLSVTNIPVPYDRTENGIPSLTIMGVPVIAVNFWDRIIQGYLENGVKYTVPHRILLSFADNLLIGCEESGSMAQLKPFYYDYGKKYVIDFGSNIDAKVGVDSLLQYCS